LVLTRGKIKFSRCVINVLCYKKVHHTTKKKFLPEFLLRSALLILPIPLGNKCQDNAISQKQIPIHEVVPLKDKNTY
jgi:hypothetical protein